MRGDERSRKTDNWVKRMVQLRSWLADTPLATKLFIFSAILIIVPLFLVGIISYHQTAVELEGEAREFNWQVAKQAQTHVEYYVRDLEVISLKILNHPDLLRLTRAPQTATDERSVFYKPIVDMLKSAVYSRPDLSAVTVILDEALSVNSNNQVIIRPAALFRQEWWYQTTPMDSSPLIFSRIIEMNGRQEPVMTLARRIYSSQTLDPIGMLLIDVNYRRIRDIAEEVTVTKQGYFFILDSVGRYVYHPQESKVGQSLEKLNFNLFSEQQAGKALRANRGLDFLTYSSSSYLGWYFAASVPYLELSRPSARIGETVLLTTLLALAAAYILGVFFTSSILRPIQRLQHFMRMVEKGDFRTRVLVENSDELGQLSRGFNKMVERLDQMVEEVYFASLRETEVFLRQKEMELKVLQSQINPHFLYNSLETIRGMALERQAEDIATMSSSLGQLLRYNLRNQQSVVQLREEIRFSQLYLQIQEYRFENQFTYELHIPDWAWDLAIVKFSLQPVLENCFSHGMGLSGGPLRITISVEEGGDGAFCVIIADNGSGIEPDRLEEIRHDLRQRDVTGGGVSIGLVNVHKRIVRLYEGDYGLSIDSIPGEGTTVILRLPMSPAPQERDR